jgi:hypothetical protein
MFDMKVANRFAPTLNLGFDTLTAYPQAGSGGANTTCDSYIYNVGSNATWATLHDAASGTSAVPSRTWIDVYIIMDTFSDRFSKIGRSIITIDTSSLTSDVTISSSVLSLYGTAKNDQPGISPTIDVYGSTPAANNNIVTADFDQIGATSYTGSPITYSSWSVTGYNNFTFNATGNSNVSKTGITRLGIREAKYDAANSAPTWTSGLSTNFECASADDTSGDKDPKLVVTYSMPASGPTNLKTYNTNLKANIKTINTNPIANCKSLNTKS